jgi:hypothetical protein
VKSRSRKTSKPRDKVFCDILKDSKREIKEIEDEVTKDVDWSLDNLDLVPLVQDMVKKFTRLINNNENRDQHQITKQRLKSCSEDYWKSKFLNRSNQGRSSRVFLGTRKVIYKGQEKEKKRYSRKIENPKPKTRDENGRFCKICKIFQIHVPRTLIPSATVNIFKDE